MSGISDLKLILRNAGLYTGDQSDVWNDQLSDALVKFQAARGLTPSGVYDQATQGAVRELFRTHGVPNTFGPADDAMVQEALQRYGPAFAVFINHPEIGPIIRKGAAEDKDSFWLTGQLQKTQYWKQTSEASRKWEELKISDPGAAKRQIEQARNKIRDLAGNLGVNYGSDGALSKLADDSLAFQWDDQQISDMLVGLFRSTGQYQPGTEPVGDIGSFMGDIKRRAALQLLPISDDSAFDLAMKMASGETNVEAVDTLFRAQAKAKVPHLAQLIDDGVSLADIFEPHKQRIAQTLEVGADSVDFVNDPKWAQVTSFHDPATNTIRMMTETEAATVARKTDAWKTTNNSNALGTSLVDAISQAWGVRGQ